jgi:hypothetical protein
MNRTKIAPYMLMSDLSKMLMDGVVTKVVSVSFGMEHTEIIAFDIGLENLGKLKEYCQKNNLLLTKRIEPQEPDEYAIVRICIYYHGTTKNTKMESDAK